MNACVGSAFYLFKSCVGRASHRGGKHRSITPLPRGIGITGQGVLRPCRHGNTFLIVMASLLVATLNQGRMQGCHLISPAATLHVDMCHLCFIPGTSDIMESAGVCIMNPDEKKKIIIIIIQPWTINKEILRGAYVSF